MEKKKEFLLLHADPGVSLQTLWQSATEEFVFSWDKNSLPHPARYGLFFDGSAITAAYRCPIRPWSNRADTRGEFVRGLWEYDVAELFIHSPADGAYQEFNLAPSGAWWSCHFSGYRKESNLIPPVPSLEVDSADYATGWAAAIRIPLSSLALRFQSFNDLKFNVCFIQGENPRHYLSGAVIGTSLPDFHHAQSYLPATVR